MKKTTTLLLATLVSSASAGDFAQNIIPTSNDELRALSADRPDSTETPITVDKGHWQIETSVLGVAKDSSGGNRTETWTWGETNIKYGLTDNIDFQLIFAPYVYERSEVNGNLTETEDASDITLRLKWNLWGNDGGATSFALFPYVTIPTQTEVSGGQWEAGIILPFAIDLSDKWSLGLQAEFAYVYDDEDREYDLDLLHTAVLGYSVTEKLGVYVEYLGIASSSSDPYESHFSTGFTYAINDTFQWDIGAVYGINDAAEDSNIFTGFTKKF